MNTQEAFIKISDKIETQEDVGYLLRRAEDLESWPVIARFLRDAAENDEFLRRVARAMEKRGGTTPAELTARSYAAMMALGVEIGRLLEMSARTLAQS